MSPGLESVQGTVGLLSTRHNEDLGWEASISQGA